MNIDEYNKIKNLSYKEYCAYLKTKYGVARCDYMTENWKKTGKKVTRTGDGLFVHHIYEDTVCDLAHEERAMLYPLEWQKAKNLVYCDYLEHYYLHILIWEEKRDKNLGIQGILCHILPELTGYYLGDRNFESWRLTCFSKVENDKDVWLNLTERLDNICPEEIIEEIIKVKMSLCEFIMSFKK